MPRTNRNGVREIVTLWLLLAIPAWAQSPDILAQHIVGNNKINDAREILDKDYEAIRADAVRFAETGTQEELKAVCLDAFKRSGLSDVTVDAAGNILGLRKGSSGNSRTIAVVVRLPSNSASDRHIRLQGSRLQGAGIADSYTLALFVNSIRALNTTRLEILGNILFVVTPGGDAGIRRQALRTMLENPIYKDRIKAFVELEPSATNAIITASPAARAYRVRLSGPASVANGRALAADLSKISQVHSITPFQASSETQVHFDVESDGDGNVDQADRAIRGLVEQMAGTSPDLKTKIETLEDFPAARTNVSLTIVQLATAVMKELGLDPSYQSRFSDAGVAMDLGIPAVSIGSVEAGQRLNSDEEWVDIEKESTGRTGTLALSIATSFAGVR